MSAAAHPRSLCGVCGSATATPGVRLLAAFGARPRCRRCGSVLRGAPFVRWARLPFDAVAIVGAVWLMSVTTRSRGFLLFLAVSAVPVALGLCLPLSPDARDPLTRRAIARNPGGRRPEP